MAGDEVFPVDLKQKRKAARLTQRALADKFGVARETIVRVENEGQGFSFPLALQCASFFGSITLRRGGEVFTLYANDPGPNGQRDDIPNDEQLYDLDAPEHIDNVRNQAADVVSIADRLQMRWLAIRNGCASGRNDFADFYAELWELKWAADGALEDGQKDRPDVVDEGRERAVARRPLYEGGESVEQVA